MEDVSQVILASDLVVSIFSTVLTRSYCFKCSATHL